MEVIGWVGSLAFGLCAIPQALKSMVDGHSEGVSWGLLVLWFIGEVCTLIYVYPKGHLPLIVNYIMNIIFVAIIIKYKIWRRSEY